MRTTFTLGALALSATALLLAGCGGQTGTEAMEAPLDRSLELLEQGKAELNEELHQLRSELDTRLMGVGSALARADDVEGGDTYAEEARRDLLLAQRDRVETLLGSVEAATVETWDGLKSDVIGSVREIEDWLQELDTESGAMDDGTEETNPEEGLE